MEGRGTGAVNAVAGLLSWRGAAFAVCLPSVSGFAAVDRLVCAAGRSNHPAKAFSGPLCWVADHMLNAPTPAITARAIKIPVEDPREAAREDVRLGERDGERVLRFLLAI